MNVADVAGLSRLRHWVGRLAHDDERQFGNVVTLFRDGSTVARIACSTAALGFDALRICYGLRLRRSNAAAWQAAELALAA